MIDFAPESLVMSNSTSKVSASKSQHIDVALLNPKEIEPSNCQPDSLVLDGNVHVRNREFLPTSHSPRGHKAHFTISPCSWQEITVRRAVMVDHCTRWIETNADFPHRTWVQDRVRVNIALVQDGGQLGDKTAPRLHFAF